MKINPSYKLRSIAGESVIISQERVDANLTRIISLNPSARLLWEAFEGKEFSLEDAAVLLASTYHLSPDRAARDAEAWLASMQQAGLLS